MISSRRIARLSRQWSASAGLAGAAALIGLATASVAHADSLDPVPPADGPLYSAYLAAEQLITAEGLSGQEISAPYETALESQLTEEQGAVDAFSSTDVLQQSAIASGDLNSFESLIVADADEYFANSASSLSGSLTTFAADPTPSGEFTVLAYDYQLENATNIYNFLDEIAPYLGIGSADAASAATAATDLASGLDASSFADLLSSF